MNRIKELEALIDKARNDYYNNHSTVSDVVYDAWIDELSELDPTNKSVISIGADPVSNWEKFDHEIPLGSLNKCNTQEEFEKWYNSYCLNDKMLLSSKLDGLSLSLIYNDGKLTKALTRGSGITGENILSNVKKMTGIPVVLKEKIDIIIRGEILISKSNMKKYFPNNPSDRNMASGISRRFSGEDSEKLHVLCYEITSFDQKFNTYEEHFLKLKELGFLTPDYYLINSIKDVFDLRNKFQESLRESYDFSLDGLVIHNNNLEKHSNYGYLNNKPYASIAYKFDNVGRETKITKIEVQVGNSGRITPVCYFEPIFLAGANVKKASLHNFSNIKKLGVGVNSHVIVCRANEIIPYVESLSREFSGEVYKAPENCPECNSNLIEVGEYLQCPNTTECPAQKLGKITNWIKELNILEWGDQLLLKLYNADLLKDIDSLYKLSVKDIESLERMGEKSAQNAYDALWKIKEVTLDTLIGGLSIPMIGSSTIRLLIENNYDTLDKIMSLSEIQIQNVPGIGPVKSKLLYDGLIKNKELIANILQFIKIKSKSSGPLDNMVICITGSTKTKRSDLELKIKNNGGIYKSSIGKSCTHLIIADVNSQSTKAVSARKLNIKLISEDDFLDML